MNFLASFFDDAINKDICIIGKGSSVDQIDKNLRIWVLIDLFGQKTKLQITSDKLQKIS